MNFSTTFRNLALTTALGVGGCGLELPNNIPHQDASPDTTLPDTQPPKDVFTPPDTMKLDVLGDGGEQLDAALDVPENDQFFPNDKPEDRVLPDTSLADTGDANDATIPLDILDVVSNDTQDIADATMDIPTPTDRPDVVVIVDRPDVVVLDDRPDVVANDIVDAAIDIPMTTDRPDVVTTDVVDVPDVLTEDRVEAGVADSGPRFPAPTGLQFLLPVDESGVDLQNFASSTPTSFGSRRGGTASASGFIGGAVSISTAGDAIIGNTTPINYGNFPRDFGLAAWVRVQNSASAARTVFAKRSSYSMFIDPTTGALSFTYSDGTCSINSETTTIPNDTWTHVALTLRGSLASLWINGNLAGTASCTPITSNTNPIYIGGSQTGTSANRPFGGLLDQVYGWTGSDPAQTDVRNIICADQLAAGVSLASFCR